MDASVTFLLENLKQVVENHAKLVSGAAGELKGLQSDLEMMEAKLKDASTKQNKEDAFKAWEKRIRNVVYQVEDTIDACLTDLATKNKVAKTLGLTGTGLAKQVKSLRDGPVKEVFNEAILHFASLQMSDEPKTDEKSMEDWRSKEPKETHIVGLVEEATAMIKYIREESTRLEVVSVIGMPGLGKTTFVWKIFQDPDIQYEFPVRIWVTVSATLDRKTVFLNMLKEFTQQEGLGMKGEDELALLVKERLERGKFLIVLDDMWTAEAWDRIKPALPVHNGMCKVLITTRNKVVGHHAVTTREPYQLRFLNPDESWELLQYGVYDNLDSLDPVRDQDLVRKGKLIADNCDGLPLSIVVISGILRDKIATLTEQPNLILREWEKISVSVKDYLMKGDTSHKGKLNRMSRIIELSYTRLHYDVRDCFLYMGMFPEDAPIPARELTQLWIAEGFIQPNSRDSLEDIAKGYLNDLISRGLVMLKKTRLDGDVKICSIHDSIREFCKNKADEKNLFKEIRMIDSQNHFEPPPDKLGEHRRLSIHSHIRKLFDEKPAIPSRSFLCFPKDPINLKPTDITYLSKAFGLLRVFAAQQIKFPKFPSKITELIHIRYLTLSLSIELKFLPDAIFNLWNLQTLIVETLSRTLEIKADIWKLIQLRHFKTKASIILSSKDVKINKGGESLQTIGRLSPESCTESVFTKAKNLLKLAVHGDISNLLESKCLAKLRLLNNLKLEHEKPHDLVAEDPLGHLPNPNSFPPNLRVITLQGTYLSWTQMSTLEKLENLEVIKLKENAFKGSNWDVYKGGFYKLQFLFMERIDLNYWTAKKDAFPKLRSLTLKNCEVLKEVSLELEETLETLSLERVTHAAVTAAKALEKSITKKNEEEKKINPNIKRRGFKLLIGAGDKNSAS